MLKIIAGLGAVLGSLVLLVAWVNGGDDRSEAQGQHLTGSSQGIVFVAGSVDLPPEAEAALQPLASVTTPSALHDAISDETTTIILDSQALTELSAAFLADQLVSGRSIIGLDVPLAQLAELTGFETASAQGDYPPAPGEAFYSLVSKTPDGSSIERTNTGQKSFSSGLFSADLAKHLEGANSDLGIRR